MASNNDWTPLPQRKNGNNKKNKENQAKLIKTLTEMFGTTFESDILASVAQTCNWKREYLDHPFYLIPKVNFYQTKK